MKLSLLVALSCFLLIVLADVGRADDKDTIPPEILKQYDPDIRAGKRPTLGFIRQGDIFGLRDNPTFKEDCVRFDFDPAKLSSVQREIIQNWVKAGHAKVYLRDDDIRKYAPLLGCSLSSGKGQERFRGSSRPANEFKFDTKFSQFGKLLRHPVNTDCRGLLFACLPQVQQRGQFSAYYYEGGIAKTPGESITIVENRHGEALCGVFFLGEGKVYFRFTAKGTDHHRFALNWWQWVLGLRVPGAATTDVGGFPLSLNDASQYDVITLRNGDMLSGTVTDKSVTIKTSSGSLTFAIKELGRLSVEGAGDNVDVVRLKIGDKLSGSIQNDTIKVKLVGGNEIELPKDKIRDIQMRQ